MMRLSLAGSRNDPTKKVDAYIMHDNYHKTVRPLILKIVQAKNNFSSAA